MDNINNQITTHNSLIEQHQVFIDFINDEKNKIIENYLSDKNNTENECVIREVLLKKLQDHVLNSPIVLAAITESVHRYFYDNILNNRKVINEDISSIQSSLYALNPDWRNVLHRTAEKYNNNGKINKNLLISKPKIQYDPIIKIDFKDAK